MSKKIKKREYDQVPTPSPVRYQIYNKTQRIFPVPYYTETGETKFLNMRLQKGRRGQTPPIIKASQVTPGMRKLEQRGFIELRKL